MLYREWDYCFFIFKISQQIKYLSLHLVLEFLQFGNEFLFLSNIPINHGCPEGILVIKGEVIHLMYNHIAYVLKQHFEKWLASVLILCFFSKFTYPCLSLCIPNATLYVGTEIGITGIQKYHVSNYALLIGF